MSEPYTDFITGETKVLSSAFPEGMIEEVRHFLKEVHPTLEPGRPLYPAVFNTKLFFPLQRQVELERMIRLARSTCPKTIMEIGADKGGGLYHWCQVPSVENVIACEVRGTPYDADFAAAFPNIKFLWLPVSSYDQQTVQIVKDWLASQRLTIDCLFLDGDKSAFDKDFEAYLPLMSQSGVVFMHDISDEPMATLFAQLGKRFNTSKIKDTSDSERALENKRQGRPSTGAHEAWLRHWGGRSCVVGVVYVGEPK